MNMTAIRVWPDFHWEDCEDAPPSHRSDDYRTIEIPTSLAYDESKRGIEVRSMVIAMVANGASRDYINEVIALEWIGG